MIRKSACLVRVRPRLFAKAILGYGVLHGGVVGRGHGPCGMPHIQGSRNKDCVGGEGDPQLYIRYGIPRTVEPWLHGSIVYRSVLGCVIAHSSFATVQSRGSAPYPVTSCGFRAENIPPARKGRRPEIAPGGMLGASRGTPILVPRSDGSTGWVTFPSSMLGQKPNAHNLALLGCRDQGARRQDARLAKLGSGGGQRGTNPRPCRPLCRARTGYSA